MPRARMIGTIAGLAGTPVAATALAAWLIGRLVSDRYGWSQWLLWIPTPAMLPVVLLGAAAALRPERRTGQRRRRLVTWGGIAAALAVYFLAVEHRFLRFGGRNRAGLTILHSPVYPGRPKAREPYVDRLIAAGADVTVLGNTLVDRETDRIERELGGAVTTAQNWPFMVISRLPIVEVRQFDENRFRDPQKIRITLFRLEAGTLLSRPLNLYAVDLPADPKRPRWEIARTARRLLEAVEAPPPDLVVGDFNMTRGSASMAALFPGLTHAFDEAGRGYGATFHRALPLYHLDHALLADWLRAADYELVDLETGRHLGQRVVITAR